MASTTSQIKKNTSLREILKGSKTLIADPKVLFRQSLKNFLFVRFPVVDIKEASDGKDDLGNIEIFHPSLVFPKIHLPASSGFNLVSRIKARYPAIMIAVLTSYNIQEYRVAAIESGFEHMIPKDDWTGEDIL